MYRLIWMYNTIYKHTFFPSFFGGGAVSANRSAPPSSSSSNSPKRALAEVDFLSFLAEVGRLDDRELAPLIQSSSSSSSSSPNRPALLVAGFFC